MHQRLKQALCATSVLLLLQLTLVADDEANVLPQGIVKSKPAKGVSIKVSDGYMIPYTLVVPGSNVKIEMVPVPGGVVKLGSPETEDGREEDEGPEVSVEVPPMWVAKYETTWQQYKLYMAMYKLFKSLEEKGIRKVDEGNAVNAVTAPTELYDPTFTFKYGEEGNLPAATMTQYAAKQYTKWLSKLTGHQYRLPTEAEWEYACSGGAETAYHFGDDPADLEDYAWFFDNSDEKPNPVGQKKPNQFGLYDMHGNVMEWVIDGYTEDGYESVASDKVISVPESIRWSESFDNRVVRGGSWQDDPEQLRSAARVTSEDEDWKAEDPNVPLSPWWYTDDPTRGVGFRIFRSYKPLGEELVKKFWDIDNEDIEFDVEMRISGGRGAQSVIDKGLAEAIKESIK